MTLIQSEVTANQQRTPGERKAGEQEEEGEAGRSCTRTPSSIFLSHKFPTSCLKARGRLIDVTHADRLQPEQQHGPSGRRYVFNNGSAPPPPQKKNLKAFQNFFFSTCFDTATNNTQKLRQHYFTSTTSQRGKSPVGNLQDGTVTSCC